MSFIIFLTALANDLIQWFPSDQSQISVLILPWLLSPTYWRPLLLLMLFQIGWEGARPNNLIFTSCLSSRNEEVNEKGVLLDWIVPIWKKLRLLRLHSNSWRVWFLFLKGSIFVISWCTPISRQDKKGEPSPTLSIGESGNAGIKSVVILTFLLFVVIPSQHLTLRLELVNKI